MIRALLAAVMAALLLPTAMVAGESPAAPGRGFRPGHGGQVADSQFDNWVRLQLGTTIQLAERGQRVMAHRTIGVIRAQLVQRPDFRYQRVLQGLSYAEGLLGQGAYYQCAQALRNTLNEFGQGGGGGGGGLQPITQNLQQAGRYLQANRPRQAMRFLQEAYHQMANHHRPRIRRLADEVARAYNLAQNNQSYHAERVVQSVLRQLGNGGGGGQDPDYSNRQEWRRDIRDLIDTIGDGNLRMAKRDIQTLMRDIKNDGYDWNSNRQYYQQVGYVGQNLYRGNERWAMRELQRISQSMNF